MPDAGDLAGRDGEVLSEAGLVRVRPQGQRRLYAVRPEGLGALRDFLVARA